MQDFERAFMRTLRQIYDTERQLVATAGAIAECLADHRLIHAMHQIEEQSGEQVERLEALFALLYLEPRPEACWATTALLRDASDSCGSGAECGAQGCAAALLAIKRYEVTLYEALLRWSEQCHLDEAVPDIRRSIAEELVQATVLADIAFVPMQEAAAAQAPQLKPQSRSALH
jgi:ferritin-like metal-binding protein YciE